MLIERNGEKNWNKRFELGFDFPYFDGSYNYIICDDSGWCDFDGSVDFAIRLLTFGYEYDTVQDSIDIQSDLRYHYTQQNGLEALVLQFTKNRLHSDPSIDEFDSYVNFQWSFYEDGAIEIRFGDFNLDNSPCYVPGEGFYINTVNAGFIKTGPDVSVNHPTDTLNKVVLNGDFDDFIITNNIGVLRTLPPEGWVIRFERNLVNTQDIVDYSTRVFPNPSDDYIHIESDLTFTAYQLHNLQGQVVKGGDLGDSQIEVSDVLDGFYVLKLLDGDGNWVTRKISVSHLH